MEEECTVGIERKKYIRMQGRSSFFVDFMINTAREKIHRCMAMFSRRLVSVLCTPHDHSIYR